MHKSSDTETFQNLWNSLMAHKWINSRYDVAAKKNSKGFESLDLMCNLADTWHVKLNKVMQIGYRNVIQK